ncbi:1722_t:CDS:2, partial [Acaulospora colombiana]
MPSTASAATIPALLPPVVASLKRKIPPDDVADSHRPTKIRITLRLPPRTPIPKRPRPIVPAQFYSQLSQHPLASSDEDSSSSGNTDSSLVADDTPIAIPCARSGPTFCLSRPFYDTCEPPPDSEDEDEDFHNSMLRPELEEDEDLQPKEEDYFDIKEEEIADFVLDLATPESLIAAQQPAVVVAVKVEDGVDVTCQPMTARPELEWSALKLDESMFNPLVDMLARTDSPAASAEIEETGTSSVSPAPGPGGRGGSISAESSLALAVPPPTPWIKTEEESAILLEDKPSSSISPHGEDVIEDDPFPIVDDHFAPVQSPMDTLPVHQPPWEHGWAASSSIGGGPESVTTDEVDLFDSDPPQRDGIQASTSAPHFTPLSQPQPRARRPLRLSVSGLHPFHDGIRGHQLSGSSAAMRAGHARRHSHAAGITTSNHRRMSIISNAFSDWASGTPEDSEAPLTTPSHTAWRHYQWPGANGSSSTLAHERIEEKSVVDEDGSPMEEEPKADLQRQSPPHQAQKQQHQSSSAPPKVDSPLSLKDELDQLLTSTTFNQVTIRALPAGHRMSTLVLLGMFATVQLKFATLLTITIGIPVFQYSVEYPPIELIRRMDTDFINISSLIIYGRF